jgi:hypothetical protein
MIVGEAYYTDENLKPQHAMCVWDEEENNSRCGRDILFSVEDDEE